MGRPSDRDEKDRFSKVPSQALQELMDSYGTIILRTAYFYVKDVHLAEDISQEVFLRAYKNWSKFRGDSSVKTWLVKITVNVSRDKLRPKRAKEEPIDPKTIRKSFDYNLEDDVIKRMNNTEILKHVLALPPHYQEVLYLFYYVDLNIKEIAKMTKSPAGTVRGRLFRARKMLGEHLEKEGLA